jgi:NUDIX domain
LWKAFWVLDFGFWILDFGFLKPDDLAKLAIASVTFIVQSWEKVAQMKKARIRPLVLGLICDRDRILVAEGYDSVKQEFFYRCLGGGVDFGETSLDALKREFQEEIQAEVCNIEYLGCVENLFIYEGNPGHEWIQFYKCDLVDPKFYQLEKIIGVEGKTEFTAKWVECDRFRSHELHLVPEICLTYL